MSSRDLRNSTFFIALIVVFLFSSFTTRARLAGPQSPQGDRKLNRDTDRPWAEVRVALVIGNGAYSKGRLKNPPNDARAMAAALREVGFEATEVIDADKVRLQRAIRDFGKRLKETAGVGLFYYAGHGIQVAGHNYLVPLGAETEVEKEEDVDLYCLDAESVLKQMEGAGARINIVILDACRDNPFSRSFSRDGAGGLAEIKAPSGTLIAYATDPGRTASDGDGANGLYTQELLARIRQPGLRIEDVFNLAGAEVERKSGRKQQPWISSKLRGAFYFRPPVELAGTNSNPVNPVKPADPGTAEQEAWNEIRDSTDPEDFREFLKSFPNGVNAPTARFKLKKLEIPIKPGPDKSSKTDGLIRPSPKPAKTQVRTNAGIEVVFIPAGEFKMGSRNGKNSETPVHRVVITEPFWMGKYEVTQRQWRAVMGDSPSSFGTCGECPVEKVSWNRVQEFLKKLNEMESEFTFDLPTEAQWEYACRAGTTGDYSGNLDEMTWYDGNSGIRTHPVGQKKPNAFGLYDMHGNVWEWCRDWYDENFYSKSSVADPENRIQNRDKVLRGGAWDSSSGSCRSSNRSKTDPANFLNIFGFRVVALKR